MASKKPAPKKTEPEDLTQVGVIHGAMYDMFGGSFSGGILAALSNPDLPKGASPEGSNTNAAVTTTYPHPVNVESVLKLKDISSHHCACIQAKKFGTIGLGFIDEGQAISASVTTDEAQNAAASLLSGKAYVRSAVDDKLDPLTHYGFSNDLLNIAEDFMDTGTGYMEVVRNASDEITWLGFVPTADIWAISQGNHIYYLYRNPVSGQQTYFAKFGIENKKWLFSDGPYNGNSTLLPEKVSEIIPFICPSNRVRHYGYPEWLSAATDIDLLKKAKQYKADFYHNRGVMDFIIAVMGESMDSDKWAKIETAIRGTSGMGNNFKNLALNLGNPDAKLQVEKLASENGTEEQFGKDNEVLSQNIVSAHRIPPLLANILIPGKLGAANEFVNALIAAQLLVFGPYQNIFQSTLAKTLAGPDGIKGIKEEDFRLRTITSQINLTGLDTIGKMRSGVNDPQNADRDLQKGVKK